MIVLASYLLGVGIFDLLSAPAGLPERWRGGGLAAGTAIAVIGLWAIGLTGIPFVLASAIVGLLILAWAAVRPASPSSRQAARSLLVLGGSILVLAVTGGAWEVPVESLLQRWLNWSDLPGLGRISATSMYVLVAGAAFLLATSNGVVRLSLAVLGTPVVRAESQLRGGRLIGPLERMLIYGLALAGQPTAAALVISAKGLLRFPELNQIGALDTKGPGPRRIDEVTEYLLVGSLVSWIAALSLVLLVVLSR